MSYPVGMASSVGDADCASLRHSQECKLVKAGRINNGFEIVDPILEGRAGYVAVG